MASDIAVDINIDITIDLERDKTMNEVNDSNRERWEHRRRRLMRHWMRHTAMVPKGFLRYQLLKMLNEKPMSGSEIMAELESKTNGYWKPSPGSIYPLLAWLQDKGYVKEAAEQEPGIRRCTLTEQGKTFLDQETKRREELDRRLEHFGTTPGFVGPMWFGLDREDATELRRIAREFGKAVRDMFHEIRREHSKEATEQAMRTLEEATKKLQDITRKLREQETD
jgi:DNA-binding PadR family transcriptional regulator